MSTKVQKRRPTLKELVQNITSQNRHKETDWGKPQGREITNKKALGIIGIIVIIAVLALLGGGAIYYKSKIFSMISTAVSSPTALQDETADWKTYRNEDYGFELSYPKNLRVETRGDETSFILALWGADTSDDELPTMLIITASQFPSLEAYKSFYEKKEQGFSIENIGIHKVLVRNRKDGTRSFRVLNDGLLFETDERQLKSSKFNSKLLIQGLSFIPKKAPKSNLEKNLELQSLHTLGKINDAKIQQLLSGIRINAEYYYDDHGGYGMRNISASECPTQGISQSMFDDAKIKASLLAIRDLNKIPVCALKILPDGSSVYAISAAFQSEPRKSWCIDSTGVSHDIFGPITEAVCPSSSE